MAKQAKILAFITGIVEIVYFIVTLVVASQAAKVVNNSINNATMIDPNNAQQVEALATDMVNNSGGLLGSSLLSILLVIAIIVLGIVTLIMFTKVSPNAKGRTLGIVGSIMAIAGFVVGWVPVLSYIVIIATAALLIIAGITTQDEPNNSYNNGKMF